MKILLNSIILSFYHWYSNYGDIKLDFPSCGVSMGRMFYQWGCRAFFCYTFCLFDGTLSYCLFVDFLINHQHVNNHRISNKRRFFVLFLKIIVLPGRHYLTDPATLSLVSMLSRSTLEKIILSTGCLRKNGFKDRITRQGINCFKN